ncbi:granulin b isoform X2 [Carassius auratus]|uniref:Granulin b isoform X2 n=1 Tax=Carassius auratus TaxID=7957 RepID=A0A6P6NZR8_CARAU|nr:granulins-like isoform X2 [Carassius auratus]
MVRACVVVLLCVCLNVCGALICPDGGMCEDGNTCCQTPSGRYGCCPLPNAECCSDHLHCCYQGTLCDLVHSKCVNKTHILDWVEKVTTKPQAVICPDQESECPDDTTCCQMPDGSWGCCPMKNAVCCEDKRHCCPQGTQCDLEHSMCVSATYGSSPLWRKFAARRRKPSERTAVVPAPDSSDIRNAICPDKVSTCPDDTTCCKLENGSYSCCPLPKAVCCSDHLHCCPEDTTCDLVHSMCVSANGVTVKMATKTPAASLNQKEYASVHLLAKVPTFPIASSNQKCDDTASCPDGSTCCRMSSGKWGCCPLPQAVCCEDHLHCCPHDTVCNLAASTCDSSSDQGPRFSVPLVKKTAAVTLPSQNQNCDETSLCPAGTTCCRLTSGSWACCPMPQAVCCADQEHCCPQGYKCDSTQKTCVRPGLPSMPWFRKQSALKQSDDHTPVDRHMCDNKTSCPKDDTCCFMKNLGKWGCCPLPKAVCCEDGDHCCPRGYKCNEKKTTCTKAYHEIPWYTKQEARVVEGFRSSEEEVVCDASTRCLKTQSCCRRSDSTWACCPYKEAVCCVDMKHCCPVGYRCDPEVQGCTKASTSMWWENSL